MSTATIELSSTRRQLFDSLGDNQHQYLDHIKNWFRKRCTKEEFDSAARKLLSPESVHLHNQFLLALLNKCQTLVNISPCPPLAKLEPQSSNIPELLSPSKFDVTDRLKKGKIKRKSKPNRASLEHRFQPVLVSQCAPEVGRVLFLLLLPLHRCPCLPPCPPRSALSSSVGGKASCPTYPSSTAGCWSPPGRRGSRGSRRAPSSWPWPRRSSSCGAWWFVCSRPGTAGRRRADWSTRWAARHRAPGCSTRRCRLCE